MFADRHLPPRVALLLQRVADGEASDRDLERYARLVAADPTLEEEVAGVQELSRTVRLGALVSAADVDFRALQARVLQAVSAPQARRAPFTERLGVWLREAWTYRPSTWAPVTAVGVAAVMALVVPRLAPEPEALPPEMHASRATEIHTIETDSQTAMVFQTPGSGMTVIWLAGNEPDDDEDEVEDAVQENQDVPDEVKAEFSDDSATAIP